MPNDDSQNPNSFSHDPDSGLPSLTDPVVGSDLSSAPPAPTFDTPSPAKPAPPVSLPEFPRNPQPDASSSLPPTPPPPAKPAFMEAAHAPSSHTPHALPPQMSNNTTSAFPPSTNEASSLKKPAMAPDMYGSKKSSSGIALMILGLITLLSTAAATFLYTQNQDLQNRLDILTSINQQREVPISTPTPLVTPDASSSATISGTPKLPAPTPSANLSAFNNLADILRIAQSESPTAQLLMITSDNLLAPTPIYKFWFRRASGARTYFFVQQDRLSEPKLFTSATVNPDNNIPNLIDSYQQNQLGLDSGTAYDLALSSAGQSTSTAPSTVTAKFLRTTSSATDATDQLNLWQFVFKFPATSKVADITIQIDAQGQKVVFNSAQ